MAEHAVDSRRRVVVNGRRACSVCGLGQVLASYLQPFVSYMQRLYLATAISGICFVLEYMQQAISGKKNTKGAAPPQPINSALK